MMLGTLKRLPIHLRRSLTGLQVSCFSSASSPPRSRPSSHHQQQQRPHPPHSDRPRSNDESIAEPVNAPINPRHKFEEDYHLARALSKFDFDANEIRRWKNTIKLKKWTVEPYELYPQAPYELDALEEIHSRSYTANVLLEVRDVRVPASSHHPSFTRLAKHRLHLICYTHADMIDKETRDRVEAWSNRSWPGSRSIFVDTRDGRQDLRYDLLYDSLLQHLKERGGVNAALTVGVANTGKSSLLMALIRTARSRGEIPKKMRKATYVGGNKKTKRKLSKVEEAIDVGDRPGKTRVITEYLLRETPRAFFLDVPGMTPPPFFFAERPEAWYGFGAANLLPLNKNIEENLQIQMSFCDYVLHAMNRDGNFGYVKKLNMDKPTDDLNEVLQAVPIGNTDRLSEARIAMKQCQTFLKFFNTGNFGSVILDDISKTYKKFVFKDHHFTKKYHKYGKKKDDEELKARDDFFDDDFNT